MHEKVECNDGVMSAVGRDNVDRSEKVLALVEMQCDSVLDVCSHRTRIDPTLLLHGHASIVLPQGVPPHGVHHRRANHSSEVGHSMAHKLNWCEDPDQNVGGAVADRYREGIPDEETGDNGGGTDDTHYWSSADHQTGMMPARDAHGAELMLVPHGCPGADSEA